jgi:hypothetical protein
MDDLAGEFFTSYLAFWFYVRHSRRKSADAAQPGRRFDLRTEPAAVAHA